MFTKEQQRQHRHQLADYLDYKVSDLKFTYVGHVVYRKHTLIPLFQFKAFDALGHAANIHLGGLVFSNHHPRKGYWPVLDQLSPRESASIVFGENFYDEATPLTRKEMVRFLRVWEPAEHKETEPTMASLLPPLSFERTKNFPSYPHLNFDFEDTSMEHKTLSTQLETETSSLNSKVSLPVKIYDDTGRNEDYIFDKILYEDHNIFVVADVHSNSTALINKLTREVFGYDEFKNAFSFYFWDKKS
jgi:hypothetical protein